MTQEELYVRLLNRDDRINPSEVNPEFLKNYEIAKLVLGRFEIHCLSENQQRNLNLEAVSNWFKNSKYIHLEYDVPEISELLPEKIVGDLILEDSLIQSLPQLESIEGSLDLWNSQIQSFPELESVGGFLDLQNSEIQSLPKLRYIGGCLDLRNSQIQSLPKLESIERDLFLKNSKIQSLPELKSVEGNLFLQNSQIQSLPKLEFIVGEMAVSSSKVDYWISYFHGTERTHLAEKVKERWVE